MSKSTGLTTVPERLGGAGLTPDLPAAAIGQSAARPSPVRAPTDQNRQSRSGRTGSGLPSAPRR